MARQLVPGTIVGAIVLFLWSYVAWTFIQWPGEPLRGFTNEDAVIQAVKANSPRSGNYLRPHEVQRAPGMTDERYQKAMQDAMNRMMQGPIVFAAVRLEPFGSMPKALTIKFLTDLIAALLASFLLLQTNALSYATRVIFFVLVSVVIFVGANVDEWNWWGFGNAYTAMQATILVTGWFLAGLLMSIFVRGKPAT